MISSAYRAKKDELPVNMTVAREKRQDSLETGLANLPYRALQDRITLNYDHRSILVHHRK